MTIKRFHRIIFQLAYHLYDKKENCPSYEIEVTTRFRYCKHSFSYTFWVAEPEELTRIQSTLEHLASILTADYEITINKLSN